MYLKMMQGVYLRKTHILSEIQIPRAFWVFVPCIWQPEGETSVAIDRKVCEETEKQTVA